MADPVLLREIFWLRISTCVIGDSTEFDFKQNTLNGSIQNHTRLWSQSHSLHAASRIEYLCSQLTTDGRNPKSRPGWDETNKAL
jgi:hypothetical protein